MNFILFLDSKYHEAAKALEAHYSIHDMSRLGKIASAFNLPDVTISKLSAWESEIQ